MLLKKVVVTSSIPLSKKNDMRVMLGSICISLENVFRKFAVVGVQKYKIKEGIFFMDHKIIIKIN